MTHDVDPHGMLDHVHPDLARVIRTASQGPQPFVVVYGVRTPAAEAEAVATGHSETMHSRHLPDARYGGVAMAVDVCAIGAGGALDWTVSGPGGGHFGLIATQIAHAADMLGVRVQWGGQEVGAWVDGETSHFRDWGHFQLDPSAYPA